jgi:hypothetical protein
MARGRERAGVAPMGVRRTASEALMLRQATTTGVAPFKAPEPERVLPVAVRSDTVSEETRDEFVRTLAYDILFYTNYSENNLSKKI